MRVEYTLVKMKNVAHVLIARANDSSKINGLLFGAGGIRGPEECGRHLLHELRASAALHAPRYQERPSRPRLVRFIFN